eukprot:m.21851 g.21851  ORF g.21851 m.21851 type:complete len:67 (+) comp7253_c0_seq2:172-372(+)
MQYQQKTKQTITQHKKLPQNITHQHQQILSTSNQSPTTSNANVKFETWWEPHDVILKMEYKPITLK